MDLYKYLSEDVRFKEGLKSCMNCGICTAICPAAEFFDYDPRVLLNIVQSKDNDKIKSLLKSDFIWYCGQCMSCKTRCPRGNFPGIIINVLRKASQELGFFTESKKGRQQYAIQQTIGLNILKYGYCIYPSEVIPKMHPEQGTVWEWIFENRKDVFERFGGNLDKEGAGAMRKISDDTLKEINEIFHVTEGSKLYKLIENFSKVKAEQLGYPSGEEGMKQYFDDLYNK